MFLSWGKALVNPQVGLLFIDFVAERPTRLRIEGMASVSHDDELLADWPEAQFVVRVQAKRVFPTARATSTAWRSSSGPPTARAPGS